VTLHDRDVVQAEYSTESGLLARRAAYEHATGPNAPEMVFDAVAEVHPHRYLEVGCGPGELAERVARDLGSEVIALDISPRMVELARGRGVDAREGDVEELPFADASFDCVCAAWMLYHVPDVPRALREIARVLRPGGRLVAVTNYVDHLQELREQLGLGQRKVWTFSGDNGEELLLRAFSTVETRDARGEVTFPDRDAALAYVRASITLFEGHDQLPEFDGPLVVRRSPVVFVATK
jgi:SAM-dependent methyltransferase